MRLCFFRFRCIVSCRLTEESREEKNTIDYLASRSILGKFSASEMLKLISKRRIFRHTVNSVQLMIELINDDAPPCNRPKQHRIIYQQHALTNMQQPSQTRPISIRAIIE